MEAKKQNFIEGIRKFFAEVMAELKKVSWTNRKDLIDSTWVVLVSSAFLGVFIAAIDFVLSRFMGLILK
jgi:preprotein translocase subunit SecE